MFLCIELQYIFLVGGLSESPLLQQATREKFGSRAQVLVPQEASLAVLKGTLYLHNCAMNNVILLRTISQKRSNFITFIVTVRCSVEQLCYGKSSVRLSVTLVSSDRIVSK